MSSQTVVLPVRVQRASEGRRAELQLRGVFGPTVRATLKPLLPSVVVSAGLAPANDELQALPALLSAVLAQPGDPGAGALVESSYAYLAGQGLFSDPAAASVA